MSATVPLLARTLQRSTNPAILPIPLVTTGNNVPKSLHKTRRTWRPNVRRMDLPAPLLTQALSHASSAASTMAESSAMGAAAAAAAGVAQGPPPVLRGVKMQMRKIRDLEKAGGVEGLLVSPRA